MFTFLVLLFWAPKICFRSLFLVALIDRKSLSLMISFAHNVFARNVTHIGKVRTMHTEKGLCLG